MGLEKMEKEITNLRKKLDKITGDLIDLFSKRKELVLKMAELKRKNKLPILDRKREKEALEMTKRMAKEKGLNPLLIEKIIKLLIEDAKKIQKENSPC
ncbi:chorismate mutase [Patescibacteria group bacterium]|nr:chorismate mutase [Patescibacteria group bacterium]MBU4481114.1 chorismate mutase [Patescibacteria group bacterium]